LFIYLSVVAAFINFMTTPSKAKLQVTQLK